MTTEIPDGVEAAIIKVAKNVNEQDRMTSDGLGSTGWTHQLNRQLGQMGVSLGYHPCGRSCQDLKNGWREFLWDLVWLRYSDDGKRLLGWPLALEHEWDLSDDEIDYDFEKLLLARAEHWAMVFQGGDAERHFGRMRRIVAECDLVPNGERFLLLHWRNGGFTPHVFVKRMQS